VLSEKPWKSEAVVRLCLTLFICQFLGAVALAELRFFSQTREANPWLVGALGVACAICSGVGLFIIRKPWDFDRFTRQFLMLILFVYLGLTLGAFVQHFAGKSDDQNLALRAFAGALCFQGVLLALMPRFLREHGQTWSGAFGFAQKTWPAILFGVLLAVLFLPLGELLQRASMEVISRLGSSPEAQPAVEALKKSTAWLDRAAMAVVAVLLAPLAEELLFRGILYPALKRAGYRRLALWGTSLLFALIHMNLATFVPLLLFALLLTLLYERTGNLLAPMTAHALFNILNFAKFLYLESLLSHPG
jgi:membrane protease YdiL (CAAX protease family)